MKWFDRPLVSMKIGTIPALVLVLGTDRHRMTVGRYIRVKEREGGKWTKVLVDRVNDDGYVFASR